MMMWAKKLPGNLFTFMHVNFPVYVFIGSHVDDMCGLATMFAIKVWHVGPTRQNSYGVIAYNVQ